jgi:hypothetical protein
METEQTDIEKWQLRRHSLFSVTKYLEYNFMFDLWNKQPIYLPLIIFYSNFKTKSSFKLLLLMTKAPRAIFQQVNRQNYSDLIFVSMIRLMPTKYNIQELKRREILEETVGKEVPCHCTYPTPPLPLFYLCTRNIVLFIWHSQQNIQALFHGKFHQTFLWFTVMDEVTVS